MSGGRVLLSQAHVTELEEQYVLEALRSGWVAPLGPSVDSFEAEIAERVGVRGALALSSGTAALHLGLLAAGARAGRAVLVPTMTFAATVNAVLYTGAFPVFVDVQSDANVAPDLLVEAATDLLGKGVDVCAAIAVDMFGRACDYDRIVEPLQSLGIELVEDAAEALGATHPSGAAGSFGRSAALSFNGNKIMTTSGGGMLLSNDLDLLGRARYLSTQARLPVPWYEHSEVGYNYRLSNLLAALGRAQLARLDEMIARRRAHRDQYAAAFADIEGVRLLGRDDEGLTGRSDAGDNCWLTCVILDDALLPSEPGESGGLVDGVISALDARGIEARHLWTPLHTMPAYVGATSYLDGTSERLFAHGVTLPSGSVLGEKDIQRVIDAFNSVLASELVRS